jgi:hypothetical protein
MSLAWCVFAAFEQEGKGFVKKMFSNKFTPASGLQILLTIL